MTHPLIECILRAPRFAALADALRARGTVAAFNAPEGLRAPLAAALSESTGAPVLLVAPTPQAASRAAEDCAQLLPGAAFTLPAPDVNFMRATASRDIQWWRADTLLRARRGEARVMTLSAAALLSPMMPPERFDAATFTLNDETRIRPRQLMERLVANGYERVDMVEGKGQCALRGSIVDVFPPSESSALRIEFFDDEIDSIRSFDFISQRSLEKRKSAVLPPASEWVLTREEYCEAGKRLCEMTQRESVKTPPALPELPPLPEDDDDLSFIWDDAPAQAAQAAAPAGGAQSPRRLEEDARAMCEAGERFAGFEQLAPLVCTCARSVAQWLHDPILLVCDPEACRENADNRKQGFLKELESALERGDAMSAQAGLLSDFEDALRATDGLRRVTLSEFLRGQAGLHPESAVDMDAAAAESYHGHFDQLKTDLTRWREAGACVALLSGGEARGERLRQALDDLGAPVRVIESGQPIPAGERVIAPYALSRGFVLRGDGLAVIADGDIWGEGYQRARARRNAGERIEAFTDLKEGDYVVHEQHGVGIFRGTVRLQSEGAFRDYMLIDYAGADKLYIPTDQFDRVRRFIGGQGAPTLNKLGGGEWKKQKNRVKAGLKALAFDLVRLYAERQAQPGFAFSHDNPWLRQFEDDFPYEPTVDQKKALADIYADMESPVNMDRLLCGDVGYGKTEVAMRAAFKAVMDGKQVALLAPTTILAQQHYLTVTKRFSSFPVTVDMLSRFRSPKGQKETISKLSAGKVDILVGTHRLLGKDVIFRDLGLLIVDEEQRFGVQHKEQIKHIKRQVDVLTLSATPIPRTLHMSMVGVRDMSLLETPPEGRYPVKTFVMDYSDGVIRDAILREMARDGQVYFLYNHVQSIESFYARLRALVPEARVAVAHGQMKEHALEDVMMDFFAGRYDVLLCSSIIENGLDIPRANTLVVYDADRFGLSQLYQLRGRVGRSGKMAYAYFTVRPNRIISETAQKRLSAIREFTEFGSGFRIAMRDLEIRGAGNMLGPEQSGQISTVGYDMYCKLIEETVREARGDASAARGDMDTRVDIQTDAFLPADYVRGERQRLEMYKRIALITCAQDKEDLIDELVDRFGDVPEPVMSLMHIAHLRAAASRLGIERVTHAPGVTTMKFNMEFMPDMNRLYEAMRQTDPRLALSSVQKSPAMLLRDRALDADQALRAAIPLLERVAQRLDTAAAAQT